ncbi:MAG: hypothetical protein Q7S19_03265 [bacterium]|nr:hypothetical protein [bacterium]
MGIINSPYTKKELDEAFEELKYIELDTNEVKERLADFNTKFTATLPKNEEDLTLILSKQYGINMQEYINVFGRRFLYDRYINTAFTMGIIKLAETLGITPVQCWSLFLNKPKKPRKEN